jgi:uncharacterized lipoprotein YbaY
MLKRAAPPPDAPPEELGEQEIRHPGSFPIAFRVEYTATDDQLRRGLNVEARISFGGKVRYASFNQFAFGEADSAAPHAVTVKPVGR